MGKRITIIQGHPSPERKHLGHALVDSYADGAMISGRHDVRRIEVAQLEFPLLRTAEDWKTGPLPATLQEAQEAMEWAEHLVVIYPLWTGATPALLKGFFDRVFLPGVSFRLADGRTWPNLHNIRRLAAVVTYGGDRWRTLLMGDPPRKVVTRALRAVCHPLARTRYIALHDMNRNSEAVCAAFLERVAREMRTF